jgi:hypothetical protein
MAGGTIRAVHARLRGEPLLQARLFRARTARLLQQHEDGFSGLNLHVEDARDLSQAMEQMHWGQVRSFKAPVLVHGCEMFWDRPAGPLGSAPAEWR